MLSLTSQNDYQRNLITTAEADALAAQGEYKKAATLYARCSKPFEEVALVFVDQQESDALRLYLTQKLVNLGRTVSSSSFDDKTDARRR